MLQRLGILVLLLFFVIGCDVSEVSSLSAKTEEQRPVYAGPNVNLGQIGTLPANARITLLGRNGETWAYFTYSGNYGWIQEFVIEIDGNFNRLPSISGNEALSWEEASSYSLQSNSFADPNYIESSIAISHVGTTQTVRINRAYCSFRPDISGNPTFCNDRPYPSHDFTIIVWEQDWSSYDGDCLLITGYITRFEGKAQIEATSTSQVSFCQ